MTVNLSLQHAKLMDAFGGGAFSLEAELRKIPDEVGVSQGCIPACLRICLSACIHACLPA